MTRIQTGIAPQTLKGRILSAHLQFVRWFRNYVW